MLAPGTLHDDRPSTRIDPSPRTWVAGLGAVSLIGLLLTGLFIVSATASRPSMLSPPTHSRILPTWLAGPLHGVWSLPLTNSELGVAFTVAVGGMYVFYVVAFLSAPRLRRRWTIAAIVAAHLIFLVSPPLPLTDVFNYLNYGRMEILHGLNPYAAIPALEPHTDPAFSLSNWHHLLSPYGPLFTFFTFLLVPLGVAASFWVLKAALMLSSLAGLWLLWRCAELLHRDPVRATLLVGLNPLVLVWGLGGDHNDFLMMFFAMLAVYLLLAARSRSFTQALTVREDLVGRRGRPAGGSRRGSGRPSRRTPATAPAPAAGGRRVGIAAVAAAAVAAGRFPVTRGLFTRARLSQPGRGLVLARGWSGGGAGGAAAPAGPLPPTIPSPAFRPAPAAAPPAVPGSPESTPLARAGARPRWTARVEERWAEWSVGRVEAFHFGSGLAVVCALAIKLPAAILLPIFLVVASRRLWLLAGMAVAGTLTTLASYVAFGSHLPDLGTQSSLVTSVGLPSLLGYGLGLGGETTGLRAALAVGLLVVVAACAWWAARRSGDWIAPAGVAVLVLLATLSWQAPWYVVWLLPFAALTRRPQLRVAALAFGVYVILAFAPGIDLAPPASPLQQAQARETQQLLR